MNNTMTFLALRPQDDVEPTEHEHHPCQAVSRMLCNVPTGLSLLIPFRSTLLCIHKRISISICIIMTVVLLLLLLQSNVPYMFFFSFAKAQKVACDSSEYAYIVVLNLLFLLGSC